MRSILLILLLACAGCNGTFVGYDQGNPHWVPATNAPQSSIGEPWIPTPGPCKICVFAYDGFNELQESSLDEAKWTNVMPLNDKYMWTTVVFTNAAYRFARVR